MGPDQPHYGATDSGAFEDAGGIGHGEVAGQRRSMWFAALLVLLVISEGYDFGVLNGAIVLIQEELGSSNWEISTVVSVTPLSVIPGSALGGMMADRLGRWRSLLAICILLVVGPLGTALVPSVHIMILFRALVGGGIGAGFVIVSMYLAEVAPTGMRGRLISLEEIAVAVGMLLGYLTNWWLAGIANDWRWMLGLGSITPLIVALLLLLPQVPESPRWLFAMGRPEEAEATLRAYMGDAEARHTIALMCEQKEREPAGAQEGFADWRSAIKDVQTKPGVRRMLSAGCAVAVGQTACGYLGVAYYSSTVLKGMMGKREAFLATIAMGAAKVVAAIIALLILEHTGRRPLLLASAGIVTFASSWLCIAFALDAGALALAFGFCLFMGGHAVGLGAAMLVYIAEVFTTEWRGKGMATVICVSRVFAVMNTMTLPLFLHSFGAAATFGLQAVCCVLVAGGIWAFAYETGGQSLEALSKLTSETHPSLSGKQLSGCRA